MTASDPLGAGDGAWSQSGGEVFARGVFGSNVKKGVGMSDAPGTNAPQIEYWNEVAGPKWVALSDLINAQIEPLGHVAMERLALKQGEHVLDVGCGCGHTSRDLAGRVGVSGRVLGVDVSDVMLADARARSAGLEQLDFLSADAQTHVFTEGVFDVLFSRFGVMFFSEPQAAFSNLFVALKPGGRLGFICWQEPGANPWMSIPGRAAAAHIEMESPSDPHAPGPFAFADRERVQRVMEGAGFEGVSVDSHETSVRVGGGLEFEACVEFVLQLGPAAAAIRQADATLSSAIRNSVSEAVRPFWHGDGLQMDAAVWVVSGERAQS